MATKRPASVPPSANVNGTGLETADPAEKTWQIDDASGVPAPVIRANSISFRLSHQGRVKVTFFGQE